MTCFDVSEVATPAPTPSVPESSETGLVAVVNMQPFDRFCPLLRIKRDPLRVELSLQFTSVGAVNGNIERWQ